MRGIRSFFMLPLLMAAAAPASAQIDLGEVDREIAVLEATVGYLQSELADLERAMASPDTVVWPTAEGWSAASTGELESKVSFLQMAAARPESKDRSDRLTGLGLPASLAELVASRSDRPARRLVREWSETGVQENQKMLASHRQRLERTLRMSESWLAEQRSRRQAALQPASSAGEYPQGACYIPPGKWDVGSNKEVLDVRDVGFRLIATKTKGSKNVPAGKISFYLDPRSCDAGMQVADEGYVNARWIRSWVAVRWTTQGNQFTIEWPDRPPVVYTRVD